MAASKNAGGRGQREKRSQKITVVIPCYNEARTIKEVAGGVRPYADDILAVCAKKTRDNTPKILERMGVRYLFDGGRGKGDAVRLAISTVDSGILVFIDADGSHDPKDIPRLVEPILQGKADMVIGSRMTGGSDELHGTLEEFMRLMFSNVITLIINYRFGKQLTDYQNGFRAIRADSAKKLGLKENITTIEQEMAIKCIRNGFRIAEVPSHEYRRKFGDSRIRIWSASWRYVWSVIKGVLF